MTTIKTRPPIITIAGHVDHGKTTLLNYIRGINTPIQEHGGITQHIGAYNIKTKYGPMTFLDTPGHFIFNSIRTRGIKCTDIVVLVIAADDGIMNQTKEVIKLSQNFNVPIIVAINKIDKIKTENKQLINELSKYNLISDKWGGDTLFASISAKTGKDVESLLELINLQAEMLNLKANYNSKAEGIVIDNKIDIGKGATTSIIILNGCLNIGDIGIIGNNYGKIKTIMNEYGDDIKTAYPATPVNIIGVSGTIQVGEKFTTAKDKKEAKNITNKTNIKKNISKYSAHNLINELAKQKLAKINIIIKADVQGSIEVLTKSLKTLSNDNVDISLIKYDIGQFNQSDISLAKTTNSYLIGFNIKSDSNIKKIAQDEDVYLNYFNIIYEIIEFIKSKIEKIVQKKASDNITGIAEVKKIFKSSSIKTIAGCIITHGKIKQNNYIKIFRKSKLIYNGIIESIQIFQKITPEVTSGAECGISIKNYNNIQINDQIKAYDNASERT